MMRLCSSGPAHFFSAHAATAHQTSKKYNLFATARLESVPTSDTLSAICVRPLEDTVGQSPADTVAHCSARIRLSALTAPVLFSALTARRYAGQTLLMSRSNSALAARTAPPSCVSSGFFDAVSRHLLDRLIVRRCLLIFRSATHAGGQRA